VRLSERFLNTRTPTLAWLHPARFATFRLEYGELVWGDYDLCFPIADLYHNRLLPDAALAKAA